MSMLKIYTFVSLLGLMLDTMIFTFIVSVSKEFIFLFSAFSSMCAMLFVYITSSFLGKRSAAFKKIRLLLWCIWVIFSFLLSSYLVTVIYALASSPILSKILPAGVTFVLNYCVYNYLSAQKDA